MSYRKLGRTSDQRLAMLRGLVTGLLQNGKIQTTETRAKEVQSIAEKLIGIAVKESSNYSTKNKTFSAVKLDSKGKKVTALNTSKNGKKYKVVVREKKSDIVRIDNPSRLAARKQVIYWVYKVKDTEGNNLNVANKLFDEYATKYKDRKGGYTRIYKIGTRRGDAAPMAILELV
jgi:large subunit ribosomal protein L17